MHGRAHIATAFRGRIAPFCYLLTRGHVAAGKVEFKGVHHVALICSNLEKSLEFYQGVLGMLIQMV